MFSCPKLVNALYESSVAIESLRESYVYEKSLIFEDGIILARYGKLKLTNNSLLSEGMIQGGIITCCLDFGKNDLFEGRFLQFITPKGKLIASRLTLENNRIALKTLRDHALFFKPSDIAVLGILTGYDDGFVTHEYKIINSIYVETSRPILNY